MLAYVLAIVIAMGSFGFYMAAFFVPEIHRRQDFVWSGVGLFYAVVLWFCAGRITGAVLLGQIASVALLGWLGWQTLELRRDLTPESVRTPVAWADVQRWGQTAQQVLRKYLRMGSLLAGIQAAWADVGVAIAEVRNRVAGPRGEVRSRPDIPSLRRSPAYEFETETGQGESVPSEFATVPTQPRMQASPSMAQQTADPPQVPESMPSEVSESTAPVSVTESSEAETEPAQTLSDDLAKTVSTQAEINKTADPIPTPIEQSASFTQDAIATPTASKTTSSPTTEPSSITPNRFVIFRNWFSELLQSFRKPKPQRTVIEIPTRPPSIPRSPDTADRSAKPAKSAKSSKRSVIDIPPRPPSIPRQPKSTPAEAITEPGAPETNWVDGGDDDQNGATESLSATPSEQQDANLTTAAGVRDTPSAVEPPLGSQPSAPSTPPPNEPETNWPAETTTETPSNWPIDDSETNWPDD